MSDRTDAALEEIRALYAGQNIRSIPLGIGKRAAILVVDFQHIYTRGRAATGLDAVYATARLIAAARKAGLPVFYTVVAFDPDRHDDVLWLTKLPGLKDCSLGREEIAVEELVAPEADDIVLHKEAASAFHGTGLGAILEERGIDTLLVCGTLTSGCARASVVDGMAHNIRMIVVDGCVSDRSPLLHELSMFDMGTKYGDVIPLDEVIAQIENGAGT